MIAFAQSQIRLFALREGNTSNENGQINPTDLNTGEQDQGSLNSNGYSNGGFSGFHMLGQFVDALPTLGMWASDNAGLEKHLFMPLDSAYATVSAGSQSVTLFVTAHKESWSEGDVLADVSGGTEALVLSLEGSRTIEVWKPTLVPGCYDVVLDVNNDGVFNAGTDLTSKFVVGIQNVIPEVPLGAVVASVSMFGALVAFGGFRRFRRVP
jgi:hypothetical protein